MSEMIAISLPRPDAAFELRRALRALGHGYHLEAEDIVVTTRDLAGRVTLHQEVNLPLSHALGGAVWGAVFGLVFMMPVMGTLAGAAAGYLTGKLTDTGLDDTFLRSLGKRIKPGGAMVTILARRIDADALLPTVMALDGELSRIAVSDHLEDALGVMADTATPTTRHTADFRNQPSL